MDDLGIKNKRLKHENHVVETLNNYYEVSIDWGGTLFCEITNDWDYHKRTSQLSMPGNIENAFQTFQNTKPTKK